MWTRSLELFHQPPLQLRSGGQPPLQLRSGGQPPLQLRSGGQPPLQLSTEQKGPEEQRVDVKEAKPKLSTTSMEATCSTRNYCEALIPGTTLQVICMNPSSNEYFGSPLKFGSLTDYGHNAGGSSSLSIDSYSAEASIFSRTLEKLLTTEQLLTIENPFGCGITAIN